MPSAESVCLIDAHPLLSATSLHAILMADGLNRPRSTTDTEEENLNKATNGYV